MMTNDPAKMTAANGRKPGPRLRVSVGFGSARTLMNSGLSTPNQIHNCFWGTSSGNGQSSSAFLPSPHLPTSILDFSIVALSTLVAALLEKLGQRCGHRLYAIHNSSHCGMATSAIAHAGAFTPAQGSKSGARPPHFADPPLNRPPATLQSTQ